MYRAFIGAGGDPLDLQAYSTALVYLALQVREEAVGGLTGKDATWLRMFADTIEELEDRAVN